MAIKYVPFYPDTLDGQALLDNFVRTKRILRYRDNDRIVERVKRGMPLYEMELKEKVGSNPNKNLVVHGECISTCAYLKEQGIVVDLVYIDPPFASGADYAKKVYLRRNPLVADVIAKAEQELDNSDMKAFEEKMYRDIWDKEKYLNWMYENLVAIKSVMSENASIYVHLDWHIGHYVKILMDEIFGEDKFRNEIVWCYYGPGSPGMKNFNKKHDTIFWYSKSDDYLFNDQDIRVSHDEKTLENFKQGLEGSGFISDNYDLDAKGKIPEDWWEMAIAGRFPKDGVKRVDYATEKPWALLERIIKTSSTEGMLVADFFGGSGVTSTVAHKLGRKFIHSDVNVNSILTARDRLVGAEAEFDMLRIRDGVALFRNPVQTMDKLRTLIQGFTINPSLDKKFWAGSITDSNLGMMPVYLPDLWDRNDRVLDTAKINSLIREALPDLPGDVKQVIVYYVDVEDINEIKNFIKDQNDRSLINFELRDLKQILDEVVLEDEATWEIKEGSAGDIFLKYRVEIKSFFSDQVRKKIDEFNNKSAQQYLKKNSDSTYKPLLISEEGLETIEWVGLDCKNAGKDDTWESAVEIKIEKNNTATINGKKTADYWDGCIESEEKPLRMKIRNICGDETVFLL